MVPEIVLHLHFFFMFLYLCCCLFVKFVSFNKYHCGILRNDALSSTCCLPNASPNEWAVGFSVACRFVRDEGVPIIYQVHI